MSISDHKKMIYKDQLGQKAAVTREDLGGTLPSQANSKLREIGNDLASLVGPENLEAEYVGSTAVHVYKYGDKFKMLEFATQTAPIIQLPEHVASSALDALRKDLQAAFGRESQKLRSGF
jgi:hypothetical protein